MSQLYGVQLHPSAGVRLAGAWAAKGGPGNGLGDLQARGGLGTAAEWEPQLSVRSGSAPRQRDRRAPQRKGPEWRGGGPVDSPRSSP